MNQFLEYLDNIPCIPDELVLDAYKSINENPNIFYYRNYEYYKTYCVTKKLTEYVQEFFTPEHIINVHVVMNKIAIHKDIGRTTAYNYIIDCGGEHAETCFYDDNFKLIEKHKIDKCRWHQLNVAVFHNVINLTKPRIAITVHSIK